MDTHLPVTVLQPLDTERIVEVLGVLGVDGTGEHLAEVLTHSQVLLGDLTRNLVGCILHVLRIFVGQAILSEDGIHLHVVVARGTEDVNHLADRTLVLPIRPLYDAHHGTVVGLSALHLPLGDDDVVGEDIPRSHEVSQVLVHLETSHKSILGTLQDLVDLSLLDVVLPASQECELHLIAVEGTHGIALRHKNRLLTTVGNDRVLAVVLSHKLTLHHLHTLVQAIRIVADLGKIIIPSHFLHDVDRQHLEGMRGEMEGTEYLFEAERYARLTGKEFLKQLGELRLVHPLATFLSFSHNYKS